MLVLSYQALTYMMWFAQFRSVSQTLWGTQEYHLNVRQIAVGHMRQVTLNLCIISSARDCWR